MNKYWVQFSIMAFTGGFHVKALNRSEALKISKMKFDRQYKSEFKYPKFSIKKDC